MAVEERLTSLGRAWGRAGFRAGFWWRRWWADQVFLVQLGSSSLRPSGLGAFAGRAAIARRMVREGAAAAADDALLAAYVPLVAAHYAPGGRGYATLASLDAEQAGARYEGQGSRLRPFIDAYPHLLGYRDGETFLDLGCGTGQNVRELLTRFPTSTVHALDVNADAIGFLARVEASPHLRTQVGSFADDATLRAVLDAAEADHVVISHALSTLYCDSVTGTRAMLHALLGRITATHVRSLIVIDSFASRGRTAVAIEQRTRLRLAHDVLSLLDDTPGGRAHLVNQPAPFGNPGSQAVIWTRLRST